MIPQKLTLNEFHNRKAKEYFDKSRDKMGCATKTIAQCFIEVGEDYGTEDLDKFNTKYKDYWNNVFGTANMVVWQDNKRDIRRDCDECGQLCKYPVHREAYREI